MSLAGILLGVINIAIVAAIFVLIGAIIVMIAKWFGYPIDWNVQRLYLLIVLLVVLYMLAAMLLGLPTWRVIGHAGLPAGLA
jgi:hypothetical protein